MKKIFTLALVLLGITTLTNAQNTILEARGMAIGSVVTVKGIVTHGGEYGPIRYFQDNTAGIAAYGALLNTVNKGDSVTITGTLKNYNQLLEMDPLTSVVVRSTGNPVPEPIILTPVQLMETYEARLVKLNNVTFVDAGGIFSQKKFQFTSANGESGFIYVKNSQTDIIGQPIPAGLVNITGLLSQFDYASPTAGYQLLPRTIVDIQRNNPIYLTSTLNNTSFTQTQLNFTWKTNITGTTQMYYGLSTETVKTNVASGTGGDTTHSIALTGLSAGQVIWVKAFSVNGTDTAYSGVLPFATISNSSGNIKVYFNTPVDISFSTGVNAIYLNQSIDDTLINYINRAKYTIDMAIYNFNNSGISNISNALKAAANRGVVVRVIGCGTTANLGVDELAGSLVHILIGPANPARVGIMHNKFFVFDAESANANDPLLWTGSTNLTTQQINVDANNVVIIQDQSLARSYKIEFEEMWGSYGVNPDATKARFGSAKKNNTPHEFMINGKRVESYFSPSDGTNAKIIEAINTTNHDLSIATMLLTRDEIAAPIANMKAAGNAVNMLTYTEGNNTSSVNLTLLTALGASHYVYYQGSGGIMHNKYMIVDQGAPTSDPIAWTGSHNWSAAANNDNDENTLVIHDATIANIFYQSFAKIFVNSGGVLTGLGGIRVDESNKNILRVFPNPVKNGNLNVSCTLASSDKGILQLVDINGKILFETAVKLNVGENILNYSFPGTYKGMHFLKLKTNNLTLNQKVLFE